MSFPTLSDFSPTALASAAIILTTVGIFSASYLYSKHPPPSEIEIHQLGGIWLLHAWPFFTRRYDFVRDGFHRTSQKLFQFRILQHRVIASSGVDARTVFFHDKSLDMHEGYKILQGNAPTLTDIKADFDEGFRGGEFIRRLLTLTTKERLHDVFPSLLNDVNNLISTWGPQGTVDPFTELYKLVFQVTVRMATCSELADDPEAVSRLWELYQTVEKGTTPAAILFPWFPSSGRKARDKATADLFVMLLSYVELRRNAKVPSSDAIDVLLSGGAPTNAIIEFIIGVIFAGVVNTGMNVCWILLYLRRDLTWKSRATAEVQQLMAKHAVSLSKSDPLHKRLASIPVSAWEVDMPVADAIIRETLRLTTGGGVALRRNMVNAIDIGGKSIARGDFLAYLLGDVHFDASIYSDPYTFDPGRYEAGREEDKRAPFAYLGWGIGRHPCAGMKVAKLEMKVVLALFLAGFDYDTVDGAGRPLTAVPEIDRNDIHLARPLQPCTIKFKRTEE
ncbi:cytochrome P450 [Mycena rebaudengoi]|nr:cytochrome P450 [Mycena rebaudengoi]